MHRPLALTLGLLCAVLAVLAARANDASCPVDENLAPGPCTAVGIQGGSCD